MTQKLLLLPKTVLFQARINMATITYPLSEVTFDNVTTGAFGDIPIGSTILFGSTAGGDDLGRKRVRAAADSDTIPLGRGSRGKHDGELNISDNSHITVIDTRSVWSKIPDIDSNGNVVKDEETYTDQNENIPPKANITGGWRAATINGGTSLATFQFIGSGSYAVASGATLTAYSWDVADGTITTGSGTNTITATFPAGSRWVKLTVTDSNGNTHFMEVLVYAHDPDNSECVAFQCVEHKITQQGQTCSFRILEDIPISTYPDGMPVIFWEGEPASTSDSSNVLFWGWHQTDSNTVTADRTATLKDTTLFCLDVGGRLDTLPGFPQSVTRKASPTTWLEMAGLNMDLYLGYLLGLHNNAFELASFTPTGTGSAYSMTVIASAGQSLWDQVSKMAGALVPDYELTCDRSGAIKVVVNPILQDTGDRTAVNQATITDADFVSASWERRRPPRFHWNWAEALQSYTSGDPVPIFCVAPGYAPGQGESEANTTEQLAQSQDDLNACEGHRYAYMNAFHGQLALGLLSDAGIEPADMTWVTVTIDSSYHRRQLGFSAARGLPVEVNITYNYEPTGTTKTVEVLWEEETSGTPATTFEQPEEDWDWEPPEPIEIPPPPTTQGDGFGTNYFQVDGYIARTRDLSAASPSWSDITGTITGTIYDFILDPHNPSNVGYASSSDGFWKSTTLANASPTWTQIRTKAQIESGYSASVNGDYNVGYKISASINVPNFVAFFHQITTLGFTVSAGTGELCCTITTDGGSTWSYNIITSGATPPDTTRTITNFKGAADYLPHLVGGQVVLGAAGKDGSGNGWFYRSDDSGSTWSEVSMGDFGAGAPHSAIVLHFPFNDNPTGQIIYMIIGAGSSGDQGLWKTEDGGDNWTQINTSYSNATRHGVESYTTNRQRLFHWRQDDTLWLSTDAGANWTQATASGVSGNVRAAGGFPFNSEQYYVLTTTGVFVSTDDGESFDDKSGDWANGFTTTVGSGAIVPDWTE